MQGGVHVAPVSQVPELVKKMLGQTLVTKQSGAEGKPVRGWALHTVLLIDRAD